MKRVGHIKTTYLELSETFFYAFLKNFKCYEAFVVCEETKNKEVFPFDRVYQITKPTPLEKAVGKVVRGLTFKHPAVEKKYRIALEAHAPDIIQAHFGPVGVYALPIAKKLKVPLMTSFYGFDTNYKGIIEVMSLLTPFDKVSYWKTAYRKLFSEGDYFITFGEKMRQMVIDLGCPEDKVEDCHAGVNISERQFVEHSLPKNGQVKILMVNRLVEKKGVRTALEAFAKIQKRYSKLRLRIIGDGPLRKELEQLMEKLRIKNKVEMWGMQPYAKVLEQFEECHIFLTPSVKTESGDVEGGINTTVIDALALGIPTIATEESGSQLIIDKKTGLMVKQKDADDLAEKLTFLLENPSVWVDYAKSGRKLIEKDFNQEKQTEKLEAIYDKVIADSI